MTALRIFISSPGDVELERQIARRVIARLDAEFGGQPALDAYFWEYEPMRLPQDFQTQIPPTSTFDIVVCILWARLGSPLGLQHVKPDGTPYQSGTEYEFEDAARSFKERGQPDILVYRNRTDPPLKPRPKEVLERQLAQLDALETFLERWTRDGEVFKGAITTYADVAQFEELLTEHLRKLIRQRAGADASPAAPAQRPTWTQGSPFRGLEPFQFEHAPIFRGRTRAIEDVIGLVRRQVLARQSWAPQTGAARPPAQFVLVSGASGMGKSSLVRAGVMPLLTTPGVIDGVALWRRLAMVASGGEAGLFEALAQALAAQEALPELIADGTSLDALAATMRANPPGAELLVRGALSQAAAELKIREEHQLLAWEKDFRAQGRVADADRCRAQRETARQPEASLALMVDQFEEIFTATAAERDAFLQALDALARSGRAAVIATLRSDFLPQVADVPVLAALVKDGAMYQLEPPTRAELGQIIRDPAHAAGLRFAEDPQTGLKLDEVILDAIQNDPGALPLLEFALDQLYQRRDPGDVLTFDAYHALGGVEGAIAHRAEEEYAALGPAEQASLGHVFGALVNLSELRSSERPVRRRAPFSEFATKPGAQTFANHFVAARLLVRETDAAGQASIFVAHEALFSHWARLRDWIETHRDLLRIRGRVEQAAGRWDSERRAADLLLAEGRLLAEANDLIARDSAVSIDAATRDFIQASVRAQRTRRRRRLAIAACVGVGLTLAGVVSVAQYRALGANRVEAALIAYRQGINEAERALLTRGLRPESTRKARDTALQVIALRDAVLKAGGVLPDSDPADMARIHEYLSIFAASLGEVDAVQKELAARDALTAEAEAKGSRSTITNVYRNPHVMTVFELQADLALANRHLIRSMKAQGHKGPPPEKERELFEAEIRLFTAMELTFAHMARDLPSQEIFEYLVNIKNALAQLHANQNDVVSEKAKLEERLEVGQRWLEWVRGREKAQRRPQDDQKSFYAQTAALRDMVAAALRRGENEEAVRLARTLLTTYQADSVYGSDSDIISARALLAETLRAAGRPDEARREIEEAAGPYMNRARGRIASAWRQYSDDALRIAQAQASAGNPEGAAATLNDAQRTLAASPDVPQATLGIFRNSMGLRLNLLGRFVEAEQPLRLALVAFPSGLNAMRIKINLANALLFQDRIEEAMKLYEEVAAARLRDSKNEPVILASEGLIALRTLADAGRVSPHAAAVRKLMEDAVAKAREEAESKPPLLPLRPQ